MDPDQAAPVSMVKPSLLNTCSRGLKSLKIFCLLLVGGQKVGTPQMLNAVQIIQQQGGTGARSLTVQQLQQLMKQQPQGTIQQIIHTSQPTIIATVTQSQQQPQMVTKVVGRWTGSRSWPQI